MSKSTQDDGITPHQTPDDCQTPQPNLWQKYSHLFADEQPAAELDDDGMLHSHDKTFGKLPAILIHDTGITDGAARLYAHMHWRYGRNRKNFEGRAKMAKHLGVTETTITKRIQELEAAHWIVVIERGRSDKGGAYQTPFYHVFEAQDDAEYFRFYYKPKEGETVRPRPYIEPRKSRKGKGGNPKLKAASTQVHGVNSSSHGAVNSSSHYPEAVYPDSIISASDDTVVREPEKTPKKPRKRNLFTDAVTTHFFETELGTNPAIERQAGIIAAWLKGGKSPRNINIPVLEQGLTVDEIAGVARFFRAKNPDASMPRSFPKIARWTWDYINAGKPAAPQSANQPRHANKPQPAAAPELSDSDRAALAAEVRAMREGLSNNG